MPGRFVDAFGWWRRLRVNAKVAFFSGLLVMIIVLDLIFGVVGHAQIDSAADRIVAISDAQRIALETQASWNEARTLRERYFFHALSADADQAYATYALPIAEELSSLVRNGVTLRRLSETSPDLTFLNDRSEMLDEYQSIVDAYVAAFDRAIEQVRLVTSGRRGIAGRLAAAIESLAAELTDADAPELAQLFRLTAEAAAGRLLFAMATNPAGTDDPGGEIDLIASRVEDAGYGESLSREVTEFRRLFAEATVAAEVAAVRIDELESIDRRIEQSLTVIPALLKQASREAHATIDRVQRATAAMWGVLIAASAVILGFTIYAIHRSITVEILRIGDAAARMREGDLSARVAVKARDEIGELANTLNEMAGRLDASFDRLRVLRDAAFQLAAHIDVRQIMTETLGAAVRTTAADGGWFVLVRSGEITHEVDTGGGGPSPGEREAIASGIAPTSSPSEASEQYADRSTILDGSSAFGKIDVGERGWGLLSVRGESIVTMGVQATDAMELLCSQVGVHLQHAFLYTELEELSQVDPLTRLYNRRGFFHYGETELRRASRMGRDVGLAFIDVDTFKAFNDDYGYEVGDQVLTTIAQVLNECVRRDVDIVGRYGGEEFVVLLPEQDIDGARKTAERLRGIVETTGIVTHRGTLGVTVSVGVVALPMPSRTNLDEEADAHDLLVSLVERGGRVLHEAKLRGRNRVEVG